MKLGILAHLFGKKPLHELARDVGGHGFSSIQLALGKAIGDIDIGPGRLSPGLANHVAEAFDREGVRIGVLGCYVSLIHPDADTRRRNIRYFKEHLRHARDFGTGLVALETGHADPNGNPVAEWDMLRASVSELADEAARWGVTFAIEPALTHSIDSTETMLRLLEEVPSSNLGVLLDPCNLLHGGNARRMDEVMTEAFERLADRLVLVHVKDSLVRDNGERVNAPYGAGLMNFPLLADLVRTHKPWVDLSMEGVERGAITESRDFLIRTMADRLAGR